MGCCCARSRGNQDKRESLVNASDLEEQSESKQSQPTPGTSAAGYSIPEMSVNSLAGKSVSVPQSIQQGPLSHFNSAPVKLGEDELDMQTEHLMLPGDSEIMDDDGNVHANRYYNQTRNANLSISSKFTDLSRAPINPTGKFSTDGSVTTNNTGYIPPNPTDVEDREEAPLWEDFSEPRTFNNNPSLVIDNTHSFATHEANSFAVTNAVHDTV